MMLAVCCPMLPRHSSWRLQVGQHLALPPPCSSWAKLPCPAFSDCLGLGGRDLATGPAGGGRPLGCAAELLCGYFCQCLPYTMCTHNPSWRRELAGVEAHCRFPVSWDLTSPGCMQEKTGQIQRCQGAPPAAPQSVSLGLLGRFVQRPQLLVPGFCAAVSAGRCHAGCIKYL